jgi:hypothetical protein
MTATREAELARTSAAVFEDARAAPDPGESERLLQQAQGLAGDSALAGAYTYLQLAVGIIAVLLPLVLIGFSLIDGEWQGSISDYYYTRVGNYFVGTLCALAVFFLSYNYRPLPGHYRDMLMSRGASVAALGVAFFPTTSDIATASRGAKTVAFVHLVCAGTLFALLAGFCLLMFTKSSGAMTPRKAQRNMVYRICGVVILAAMLGVGVSNLLHAPDEWNTLFWLESICVWAFGFSWLVKGGFLNLLADQPGLIAAMPPTPPAAAPAARAAP